MAHITFSEENDRCETTVFSFVTVYGGILYSTTCSDNAARSSSEGQTWNCVTLASGAEVWLPLSVLTGGPHPLLSAPPPDLTLAPRGVERVPIKDAHLHQEQCLHIARR